MSGRVFASTTIHGFRVNLEESNLLLSGAPSLPMGTGIPSSLQPRPPQHIPAFSFMDS